MYTDYCTPKVNVPFERHMLHSRKQQPDEDVMAWYSQMRKIGANCAFDEITSDEIYRDHLVSGVYKDSVREKLLERRELTLEMALDIIRNSEIKIERAKAWNNVDDTGICNSVNRHNDKQSAKKRFEKANENADFVNDCSYCGMRHAKGKCTAWRKTCRICQGMDHFAIKCRSTSQRQQQRPTRKVKNVTLASTPISRVGIFNDSWNNDSTPKRLQRMRLRLQKYTLDVTYKK